MPTDPSFIAKVLEKMEPLEVTARAMFGGYGLYFEGKNFAIVGDDTLFIKVTEPGRAVAGRIATAAPYPGARPAFKVATAKLNDRAWLVDVVRATCSALVPPKPKARKAQ